MGGLCAVVAAGAVRGAYVLDSDGVGPAPKSSAADGRNSFFLLAAAGSVATDMTGSPLVTLLLLCEPELSCRAAANADFGSSLGGKGGFVIDASSSSEDAYPTKDML